MAENFVGFVTTELGLNVLAKAIAGKPLRFTRVGLGDSEDGGAIVTIDAADAPEMTGLVNWQKDLPFAGEPTVDGGIAYIKFLVQNTDVTDGFWMRETGIFALDPDTGTEILYAYENRGTVGGWLPPTSSNEIWEQTITAAIAVGNVENITAVVASGLNFVTHDELQAHIDSTTPHPNLVISGGDSAPATIAPAIDEEQIAAVTSRLMQAETNIANLYMQLQTENDLGIKPNLMLVEDFSGETVCDNFSQSVTSATTGTRSITLADDTGLLTGSWYTLTDGVNSEFVQIVSIATSGATTTVNISNTITNSYNIANTTLRRSTMTIDDGQAYGAGNLLTEIFKFSHVWSGTTANHSSTTFLSTKLANQNSFDLEGDYAFTTDGEFTLA